MKKSTRSILSIILALVMAVSLLSVTVSAQPPTPTDPPSATATVPMPSTVTSITVNGNAAFYQADDNTGSYVYIRAILPETSTPDDLRSATVVVNLVNPRTAVSAAGLTFTGTGTTRTAVNVNLFNVAYDLYIGGTGYVLAAGLSTRVEPAADVGVYDVTFTNVRETVTADVYGSVVQNPYLGNEFFRLNNIQWTDPTIAYYIKATFSNDIADRQHVPGTLSLPAGATVSGNITPLGGDNYEFDLTGATPRIMVVNGTNSLNYVIFVSDSRVIHVDYSFNMTEAIFYSGAMSPNTSMTLAEFRSRAADIQEAADLYFANGITVPSGTTAMSALQTFLDALFPNDYNISGGTYVDNIHGLTPFLTAAGLDGWMYTDEPNGWSPTCTVPGVGAADYVLTADTRIVWFYTVDYTQHF
ncbi:MAG: DUF4430 domain-containing protein [Oscillospiraceae bacterium]|jgi:hypothetical protein|nr:DUF4430 domain-containing protein [Oscillospiraceae bacterium]